MLASLEKIFNTNAVEINLEGDTVPLHSNTSLSQGLFLQEMFDLVRPIQSLEIGFAYGISTLFILEKHHELKSKVGAHIVIEPDDYWGSAAEYNIEKENLTNYIQIKRDYSDKVLANLFIENYRIQFAYVDTTKQFDVIMHDFFMLDKLLDVEGIIVFDDCGGSWPGVQRAIRFINTLPHYEIVGKHGRMKISVKKRIAIQTITYLLKLIPFKNKIYVGMDISTNSQLGLDYSCIAFKKKFEDKRAWDWDRAL